MFKIVEKTELRKRPKGNLKRSVKIVYYLMMNR